VRVSLSERAALALVLLLVAAALGHATLGRDYADLGGAFDPTFFPRIVLAGWLALAALNLWIDLRAGTGWDGRGAGVAGAMAAALVVYVLALPSLGFFAASVPLSVLFLLLLGVRAPGPIAAVAVGVPGALVALFNHVLKMPLPTSPLLWWI
jgi:hypothetical protein